MWNKLLITLLLTLSGAISACGPTSYVSLFPEPTPTPPNGFIDLNELAPPSRQILKFPSLSADGHILVAIRNRYSQDESWGRLFVIDTDNAQVLFNTEDEERWESFAVSPDGEQIATCDGTDIYLVDWKVGTTTYLTSGCWSAWSPDGNRLAYVLYNDDLIQIRVRDLATNMEEIVYESPSAQKFLGQLVWSPTQDKLAFVQTMESSSRTIYTLCTVDADGSNYREITDHSQKVYSFTFTPDGNKFLYIDGYSPDSIRMVDLEGQYYRFEFHVSGLEEIALSSFGNKIVYQTRYGLLITDTETAFGENFWKTKPRS